MPEMLDLRLRPEQSVMHEKWVRRFATEPLTVERVKRKDGRGR